MIQKWAGLLLVIIFLTACGNTTTPPAKEGEEDEFPDFSEEQLQEMIKNNPQAQMQLSQHKTNNDDLIKKIEELLVEDPENLDHHYHLAKMHHQAFMVDSNVTKGAKAIKHYTKVIETKADFQEGKCYYNRMLCYLLSNELDKALADINQFEVVNKGRTPVNYLAMRAEIYFQKGDQAKACQDFDAALAVSKKDSLPLENETLWQERCAK